jgi:hypothetical protein
MSARRKIVQIAVTADEFPELVALCDDGTVFHGPLYPTKEFAWKHKLPEIPQE